MWICSGQKRASALWAEVASYYQEAGYRVLNGTDDASLEALVARIKAEGREKEIRKELKKLKNRKQSSIPRALAYEQYIHLRDRDRHPQDK